MDCSLFTQWDNAILKIKEPQLNLKHMFSKRKKDAEFYIEYIIIYEILKHARQYYILFRAIRMYAVKE